MEINEETMELILTPEYPSKYGKWVDKKTGKFIKWAKKPQTSEAMLERQKKIREFIISGAGAEIPEKTLHRLLKLYDKAHINVDRMFFDKLMEEHLSDYF